MGNGDLSGRVGGDDAEGETRGVAEAGRGGADGFTGDVGGVCCGHDVGGLMRSEVSAACGRHVAVWYG